MPLSILLKVAVLILAVAIAYSAVGNAGASAYLAAMPLFGIDPGTMKPTALALNVLVASIALVRFLRAGCFSWRLFWPFAMTSIPFAFIGRCPARFTSTWSAASCCSPPCGCSV